MKIFTSNLGVNIVQKFCPKKFPTLMIAACCDMLIKLLIYWYGLMDIGVKSRGVIEKNLRGCLQSPETQFADALLAEGFCLHRRKLSM